MRITMPWRAIALVSTSAFVGAVSTIAVANHQPGHQTTEAKNTTKTIAVTNENDFFSNSLHWVDVTGAKAEVTVPDGEQALLLIRFTAETVCYSNAPDHCSARVMVDDKQAKPASGTDFHFDSNYGGETDESEKAHAFDRSLKVGPGTYMVKVQVQPMEGMALRIDDWHLTVERVKI